MGVFLFNITTDDLDDVEATSDGLESEGSSVSERTTTDSDEPADFDPVSSTPAGGTAGFEPNLTPVRGRPPAATGRFLPVGNNQERTKRAARRRIAYSSEEEEAIPEEYSKKNSKWREVPQKVYKYVDDNLQVDRINMETAHRTSDPPIRDKHAIACQNSFKRIIRRLEEKGMKVNSAKTAMTCISGAQSYEARAHILTAEGEAVTSSSGMKVLGYHLSSRPTTHAHVQELRNK